MIINKTRMLKNEFAAKASQAEAEGWNADKLKDLLGKKREMLGIFNGDEQEGELEAGQSSGLIKEILPVSTLMNKLISELEEQVKRMQNIIQL